MAIVCLDWDHTLMNGRDWLPGAQTALKRLRELGHQVIIHSCNEKVWIDRNLREAGIPVDGIWDGKGKPVADWYLDDRAISFQSDGDWNEELPGILLRLEGRGPKL